MVVIRHSATAPINPAGTPNSEMLTEKEFWRLLEYKSQNPVEFVKPIVECRLSDLLKDEDGDVASVTRHVKVDMGSYTYHDEEVATLKKPIMALFENKMASPRSYIMNIISHAANSASGSNDLYMTSTYEWDHPEIEKNSQKHAEMAKWYSDMGKETVAHTIAVARQMKVDGRLS